jgi:uronate dehydrogenase
LYCSSKGTEDRFNIPARRTSCGPFHFRKGVERMKTILITGAAGDVGSHLRRELAGNYSLLLSDIKPIKGLAAGEKSARGDIAKMSDMLRITKGVDGIVHLGGFSVEGPWEMILRANIIGCYNLFEAARRNGVKRVLFASSNHATGFYKRDEKIDHRIYPKPDSRYGVSKAFGEQIGSLYADKYGMEVFCMRIGNVTVAPPDKRRLSNWISPRDFARLVSVGIDNPDIRFEIVYGVSDNRRSWYDNSNALRLGYQPQDDAERFAAEVLAKEKPGDPRAEMYQGGNFVFAEIGGDPSRVLPKLGKAGKAKQAPRLNKAPKSRKVTKSKKKK